MTSHDDPALAELLDEYFALGVAEGKEGRNHDTPHGDAQRTRSAIEAHVSCEIADIATQFRAVNVERAIASMPIDVQKLLNRALVAEAERDELQAFIDKHNLLLLAGEIEIAVAALSEKGSEQ